MCLKRFEETRSRSKWVPIKPAPPKTTAVVCEASSLKEIPQFVEQLRLFGAFHVIVKAPLGSIGAAAWKQGEMFSNNLKIVVNFTTPLKMRGFSA